MFRKVSHGVRNDLDSNYEHVNRYNLSAELLDSTPPVRRLSIEASTRSFLSEASELIDKTATKALLDRERIGAQHATGARAPYRIFLRTAREQHQAYNGAF